MREHALPILEAAGVDLVLSGHSHSYERSYLLDAHYGTSDSLTTGMQIDAGDGKADGDGAYKAVFDEANPYQGVVYVTAGSSGLTRYGPLNHPVMVHASLQQLGSLVLDVNGNRLDATFVRENGGIDDYFTILKNPDNCPLVANPDQRDTDFDGYGNACDADLDNDGFVNFAELARFRSRFGTSDPDADFDGNGFVNFADLARFRSMFGSEPGSAGSGAP